MAVKTSLLAGTLSTSKRVGRPHYEVIIPNRVHQFDLLYMPSDTSYGNKHKYILLGTDVASRYKITGPIRMKQVKDIADMIADIYKIGPLAYLKYSSAINRSEFKAEVTKMLKKHGVKVQYTLRQSISMRTWHLSRL